MMKMSRKVMFARSYS